MSKSYAPQRKLLLSLRHEEAQPVEGVLISKRLPEVDSGRQAALAVSDSVRSLGEPLDPFFAACGGRNVLSLSVQRNDRDAPAETYVFDQPFVLIGRCPEGDLSLPDAAVGFRHFYLQLLDGRWSFVNLARVARVASAGNDRTSGWLEPGDVLCAGPYTITRLDPPRSDQEGVRLVTRAGEMRPFRLELINGLSQTHRRRSRTLTNAITLIGASRQCDVWLRHESVSGIHAGLVLTPHGIWAVDLLGREGVIVDGKRVYWKQVHEGSELQIGQFRFRVRIDAEREKSAVRTAARERKRRESSSKRDAESLSGGSLSGDAVVALVSQLAEMQNQFFEHSQLQMQLMSEMVAHLRGSQQASVRRDLARIDEIGRELRDIQVQLATAPKKERRDKATRPSSTPRPAEPRNRADRPKLAVSVTPPVPPVPSLPVPLLPASILPPSSSKGSPGAKAEANLPEQSLPDEQAPSEPGFPEPLVRMVGNLASDYVDVAEEDIVDDLADAGSSETEADVSAELPVAEEEQADPVSARSPRSASASRSGEARAGASSVDAHERLTRRMAKLAQERNNRWRQVLQAFKRKPEK